MSKRFRVPNFNNRRYLDKLSNFCANKVFNIIKTSWSKKVEVYFDNCEYLHKIELCLYDFGILMCEGEVDISEIPDTIYMNIFLQKTKMEKKHFFSELYMKIANTIRHELQHILQFCYLNRKEVNNTYFTRQQAKTFVANGHHIWEADRKYFSIPIEVEAHIKSAMYIARKTGSKTNRVLTDMFEHRGKQVKMFTRKQYWEAIDNEYRRINKYVSNHVPNFNCVPTIFMK